MGHGLTLLQSTKQLEQQLSTGAVRSAPVQSPIKGLELEQSASGMAHQTGARHGRIESFEPRDGRRLSDYPDTRTGSRINLGRAKNRQHLILCLVLLPPVAVVFQRLKRHP